MSKNQVTVKTYQEIEESAQKARKLIAVINPGAKIEYTTNKFGKKLCNGFYLDDCRNLCSVLDTEYTKSGEHKKALIAHQIPLFVFTSLSLPEQKTFVDLWEKERRKRK